MSHKTTGNGEMSLGISAKAFQRAVADNPTLADSKGIDPDQI